MLLWCKSSLMTLKHPNLSHWKSLKFPSIVSLPLRVRANSNILISLSLLRLPLLSPPISSRANSKLICNSQWQRNWCLILVLGNRIMWVMREGGQKKETERQKKRETFWYEESVALSWLCFHVGCWNPSQFSQQGLTSWHVKRGHCCSCLFCDGNHLFSICEFKFLKRVRIWGQ